VRQRIHAITVARSQAYDTPRLSLFEATDLWDAVGFT
jgi:hypothetical protein